ncbi:MAG TPA: glycosyltransferase N-terminal domain-containing protein [Chitinophagaceae bacterium]|nr:glycosyltransferase N-terminal domain-containing protein [Chitinophagaceae bacterium]
MLITLTILVYRCFLALYRLGALLLSPFNEKAKRWLSGRKDVVTRVSAFVGADARPIVWFHCASLGEFEQARPLLERIRTQYSHYRILLSFFSPSGYEIRKNYDKADFVCYLPADSPAHAAQWVATVKPVLVVWIKYEYWYYYLRQLQKTRTPLLLVAGIFRPSQPFFAGWGQFHRQMLGCFTWLFVQNQASKKLLGSIGYYENVSVSGDTRFDRVIEIAEDARGLPLVEQFTGASPVIVAGSTWEEDEEELDHFANAHPEIKFIIAPHEIDEEHIRQIEKLFKHSIRYSLLQQQSKDENLLTPAPSQGNANVLIVDNIGLLATLYKYATIAYVGGGFGNDGVHNVLEAAVYSKPVVFGPVYEKFAEAVDLVERGGAFAIENALALEQLLENLLTNEALYKEAATAAGSYVLSQRGATQKIMDFIYEKRLLTN